MIYEQGSVVTGKFQPIIGCYWSEVLGPSCREPDAPSGIPCDYFRSFAEFAKSEVPEGAIAEIAYDPKRAVDQLSKIEPNDFGSESEVVRFVRSLFDAISEYDSPAFTEKIHKNTTKFLVRYNSRYVIDSEGQLHITLTGLLTSVAEGLRTGVASNNFLSDSFSEFEAALIEALAEPTESRIKTAIGKQMNLIESLGKVNPGIKKATLGAMCSELDSWPHKAVQESLSKLYGFASDYPGIRHAGSPQGKNRPMEIRDLCSITTALLGLTSYVNNLIEPDLISSREVSP